MSHKMSDREMLLFAYGALQTLNANDTVLEIIAKHFQGEETIKVVDQLVELWGRGNQELEVDGKEI